MRKILAQGASAAIMGRSKIAEEKMTNLAPVVFTLRVRVGNPSASGGGIQTAMPCALLGQLPMERAALMEPERARLAVAEAHRVMANAVAACEALEAGQNKKTWGSAPGESVASWRGEGTRTAVWAQASAPATNVKTEGDAEIWLSQTFIPALERELGFSLVRFTEKILGRDFGAARHCIHALCQDNSDWVDGGVFEEVFQSPVLVAQREAWDIGRSVREGQCEGNAPKGQRFKPRSL